jgi:hypothetical protein
LIETAEHSFTEAPEDLELGLTQIDAFAPLRKGASGSPTVGCGIAEVSHMPHCRFQCKLFASVKY